MLPLVVLAGLLAPGTERSGASENAEAPIAADSYVRSDRPHGNYGTSPQLIIDGSPKLIAYVRLPGVETMPNGATLTAATLRLYVVDGSAQGLTVRRVLRRWREDRITWSTRPSLGTSIARSGPSTTDTWIEIDVTAAMGSSIALVSKDPRQQRYGSRDSARPPVLELAYEPSPSPGYAIRGVYERDASETGFDYQAVLGFNFIDTGPYRDLVNELADHGLKGFIWLGGYNDTTCSFRESDAWIVSHVSTIAGDPGVGAYFIADEPDGSCPRAPQQVRARSDLVKSLDPTKPTFIVIYHEFDLFAGTADIIGIDRYPCTHRHGCDYSKIDNAVAAAEAAGITRYWGVIQAHGDDWYRQPTPEELREAFVHWRATNMEGYLVFSWEWPPNEPTKWLANNSQLQAQLGVENST